jgi:hypothetical protein
LRPLPKLPRHTFVGLFQKGQGLTSDPAGLAVFMTPASQLYRDAQDLPISAAPGHGNFAEQSGNLRDGQPGLWLTVRSPWALLMPNEPFARVKIDQLLRDAGWRLTDGLSVRFEYVLDDGGKADYVLFDRLGRALRNEDAVLSAPVFVGLSGCVHSLSADEG